MKYDFLIVCGFENSGNRMVGKYLSDIGYRYSEKFNIDKEISKSRPAVLRLSFPMGNIFPDVIDICQKIRKFQNYAYTVGVIIPIRDYNIVKYYRKYHRQDKNAHWQTRKAKKLIKEIIEKEEVFLFDYEAAIWLKDIYAKVFCDWLDVNYKKPNWYNANKKWFNQ